MHHGELRGLRVAALHSPSSTCECHLAVLRASSRFGFHVDLLADDGPESWLPRERNPNVVIDTTESHRGMTEWRWWPRAAAERLGWPVVGSSSATVRLCDNKSLARLALAQVGIPIARGVSLPMGDVDRALSTLESAGLGWPVVVKPVAEHSSVGVALCRDRPSVHDHLRKTVRDAGVLLLAEEYLPGREFHVCVVERGSIQVLPLVEILGVEDGIYTQAQKRGASDVNHATVDLRGAGRWVSEICNVATHAFETLGMQGFGRFDMRLDVTGAVRVLEANTKPSLEPGCAFDVAARTHGLDIETVIADAILARLEGADPRAVPGPA